MIAERILVTGASGAIGRPLTAALAAAGHRVHGVARRPGAPGNVTWHRADLLDPEARAAVVAAVRPTMVVHLAWLSEHPAFWTAPVNEAWADATDALAAEAIAMGARRFVGAGSSAEYLGTTPAAAPLAEDAPAAPATVYGRAKLRAAQAVAARCAAAGASFCWVRFFNIFAPSDPPTKLFGALLAAGTGGIATPAAVRDFLLADDAAAIVARLACGDASGIVNVATGRATPVAEFARLTAMAAGRPAADPTPVPAASGADRIVADIRRLTALLPNDRPRPLADMIARAVAAHRGTTTCP
ncbi:MAG: NAD(P)-dependent oxidoreductase [Alphaproteobacteria bacterium]|nr:NAD(P)-dependent oxidoreductase [Alphaproteobacteria bacterium]